jgi:hypothetical protein
MWHSFRLIYCAASVTWRTGWPCPYLFVNIVGWCGAWLALIVTEYSALQFSKTGSLLQSDIVFVILVGLLPISMVFWITELIYAVVGKTWIFIAGGLSLNSLGEQPDRILLTPEAVIVDSPGLREPIQLLWDEVQYFVSADYKIWQIPIYLFSHQDTVANSKSMIRDGITSGYQQIRKE